MMQVRVLNAVAKSYSNGVRFRWRCSACNHTSISVLPKNDPSETVTRDCSWCKTASIITLDISPPGCYITSPAVQTKRCQECWWVWPCVALNVYRRRKGNAIPQVQ